MNKPLHFFSILLCACFLFSACGQKFIRGKGASSVETRDISSFTSIILSTEVDANIHVDAAASPSLQLKGYTNLLPYIKTTCENGVLKIENAEPGINFSTDKTMIAEITVPSLTFLKISGASDAKIIGNYVEPSVELELSGAGKLTIENLETQNLKATISGAGDVNINGGKAAKAEYKVSGAGNINAYKFVSEDVAARVSGAGDIKLTANKTLDAKVSGAGDIKYKGKPVVTSHTSGAGDIEDAN